MPFFTIGHSNRSFEEFAGLLRGHGIELVADVRRLPGSTRCPQFNREALCESLEQMGIEYVHLERLGGRRSAAGSSADNSAWENKSFQHYADYMQTPTFREGLAELFTLAADRNLAVMCSEAVWWRCHRRLIADALVARHFEVRHILSEAPPKLHLLTPFARVDGDIVTYPAADPVGLEWEGSAVR